MKVFAVMWCAFFVLQLILLAFGVDQPLWWWVVVGLLVGSVWGWVSWRRNAS